VRGESIFFQEHVANADWVRGDKAERREKSRSKGIESHLLIGANLVAKEKSNQIDRSASAPAGGGKEALRK